MWINYWQFEECPHVALVIALLTLVSWFRIEKLKPHAPQSFPSPEFIALSPSHQNPVTK